MKLGSSRFGRVQVVWYVLSWIILLLMFVKKFNQGIVKKLEMSTTGPASVLFNTRLIENKGLL